MDRPSITLERTSSSFRRQYFRLAVVIPAVLAVCFLAGVVACWAAMRGLRVQAGLLLGFQLLLLAWLAAGYRRSKHTRILLGPGGGDWDLRALLDMTPDGVFMLDPAGLIRAASRSAAEGLGVPQAELVGRHVLDFVPMGEGRSWEQIARDVTRASAPSTLEYERDGIWFEAAFGPACNAQGDLTGFAVHFRDITAQRHAAGALQESQRTFAAAFEYAPIGMALIGAHGPTIKVNRALEVILGRPESQLLEIAPRDLLHPDDLPLARAVIAEAARLDLPAAEFTARYRRATGEYAPAQFNTSIVRRADGSSNYYVVQVQDTTERRHAQEQLLQAQKLETVGRLASGVAHDFNNLLQAMLLQIQLLGSGRLGAEGAAAAIAEVQDEVQRGKSLVRQLLLFSRHDPAMSEPLDLNQLVANTSRMLRRLVPANIAFSEEPEPGQLCVDGDRSQLEQVLLNLVVNAADAMPEGGTLVIGTGREDDGSPFLSVRDSGSGIPDEIRDRVFEPFFTTKPAERGTGLGLSLVRDIVTGHGGRIDLATGVRQGTTFKIVLPAAKSPRDAAAATERVRPMPPLFPTQSTGTRILVVEDEAGARDALQQILQALGHVVTTAGSAEEAGLLPAAPPFQVLLTDLMLPGILGTELAAGLRDRWPDLRVILMSGYRPDEPIRREIEAGRLRYLQKPFDVAALAAEVEAALASGS
ncbi:MAG: PAS domain S-box protein [Acidobacteria bacterium]|nr:MAG: PAS domain S-box protein [Acidobacteriota bacterium]